MPDALVCDDLRRAADTAADLLGPDIMDAEEQQHHRRGDRPPADVRTTGRCQGL
ncbi:MAG: hypothetical protein FWH11_12075 [Micrococcales bacterium]|nr:hypothetical protein [Micrococcales bacterium]